MPLFAKMNSYSLTVVMATLLVASNAFARLDLSLGIGGTYLLHHQSSVDGSGEAIQKGPGFLGEIRLGMREKKTSVQDSNAELFTFVQSSSLINSNSEIDETNKKLSIGAGIDIILKSFFFGGQIQKTFSDITVTTSYSTTVSKLNYFEYGPRLGIMIGKKDQHFSVMIGGQVLFGKTTYPNSDGISTATSSTQYGTFVVLRYH